MAKLNFSELSVEEQSKLRLKLIQYLEGVICRMQLETATEEDLEFASELAEGYANRG